MGHDIFAEARSLDRKRTNGSSSAAVAAEATRIAELATTLASESKLRLKAETALTSALEIKGDLQKSNLSQAALLGEERTSRIKLETQVSALKRDLERVEGKLSKMVESSSKTKKSLVSERDVRIAAQEQVRLLQNIEPSQALAPDMTGVASEVSKRLTPILAKQRRGRWDFEIVREDGRISRIIARPAT